MKKLQVKNMNKLNSINLIEKQCKIIKEQAEIIDELYNLLSLHIEDEEFEKMCIAKRIRNSKQ